MGTAKSTRKKRPVVTVAEVKAAIALLPKKKMTGRKRRKLVEKLRATKETQ